MSRKLYRRPRGGEKACCWWVKEYVQKRENIEEKIKELQVKLKKMPKGELGCYKNGKSFKWFDYSGKTRKYIYKKDRDLAQKLALKK